VGGLELSPQPLFLCSHRIKRRVMKGGSGGNYEGNTRLLRVCLILEVCNGKRKKKIAGDLELERLFK